jgi:hypothetical protein
VTAFLSLLSGQYVTFFSNLLAQLNPDFAQGVKETLRGGLDSAIGWRFPVAWPPQPPVTLMCRDSAGRLWRRSMMKSWPLGLRVMASSMAV